MLSRGKGGGGADLEQRPVVDCQDGRVAERVALGMGRVLVCCMLDAGTVGTVANGDNGKVQRRIAVSTLRRSELATARNHAFDTSTDASW